MVVTALLSLFLLCCRQMQFIRISKANFTCILTSSGGNVLLSITLIADGTKANGAWCTAWKHTENLDVIKSANELQCNWIRFITVLYIAKVTYNIKIPPWFRSRRGEHFKVQGFQNLYLHTSLLTVGVKSMMPLRKWQAECSINK